MYFTFKYSKVEIKLKMMMKTVEKMVIKIGVILQQTCVYNHSL